MCSSSRHHGRCIEARADWPRCHRAARHRRQLYVTATCKSQGESQKIEVLHTSDCDTPRSPSLLPPKLALTVDACIAATGEPRCTGTASAVSVHGERSSQRITWDRLVMIGPFGIPAVAGEPVANSEREIKAILEVPKFPKQFVTKRRPLANVSGVKVARC
jgi:hypothetical protein